MVVLSAVQIMLDHKITAQSALGSDQHPAATVRSQLSWSRSSTLLCLTPPVCAGMTFNTTTVRPDPGPGSRHTDNNTSVRRYSSETYLNVGGRGKGNW